MKPVRFAAITEKQLQANVIELAGYLGWRCYHTHDSRRSQPGFPDLVLVHPDHGILFRELKRERNSPTTEAQRDWLYALQTAGGDANFWNTAMWEQGTIYAELRGDR